MPTTTGEKALFIVTQTVWYTIKTLFIPALSLEACCPCENMQDLDFVFLNTLYHNLTLNVLIM